MPPAQTKRALKALEERRAATWSQLSRAAKTRIKAASEAATRRIELLAARTVEDLDGRWRQILRQASGEIDLPTEAFYRDRREALVHSTTRG